MPVDVLTGFGPGPDALGAEGGPVWVLRKILRGEKWTVVDSYIGFYMMCGTGQNEKRIQIAVIGPIHPPYRYTVMQVHSTK